MAFVGLSVTTGRAPLSRPSLGTGRRRVAALLALVPFLVLTACTTVLIRAPVPQDQADVLAEVHPYGIERDDLRYWGDTFSPEELQSIVAHGRELEESRLALMRQAGGSPAKIDWLALSGGGPDGAFGAGLLAGWTERGDRPEFRMVTGVSTGAIVALFAFLGPDYDPALKEIYTTYDTDDIAVPAILAGLLGGTALMDTRGYRALIDSYIDDDMIDRLAEAYAAGRILLIGTTNLDAARPVVWNLTAIAASRHPSAKQLIGDVIQASSAIPVAFPPGLIPVESNGKRYDEMHVDGGATQQVMLFSPQLSLRELDRRIGIDAERTVYVVINNKLRKPYNPVRPRIASIAGSAVSSLISGSGTGDIYKIFAIAERENIDLRVIWIPTDFEAEADELFDPVYMGKLYELGYQMGLSNDGWQPYPPDYYPATN